MSDFNAAIGAINDVIWSDWTLYLLMLAALAFTIWSRFSQLRALTQANDQRMAEMGQRWDLRGSWFLSEPQTGWRKAYQRALLAHLDEVG